MTHDEMRRITHIRESFKTVLVVLFIVFELVINLTMFYTAFKGL